MNNLIEARVRSEFFGYTHSFDRYFVQDGKQVDRLELVDQHGILSPAEAGRCGIPYSKNTRITMVGVQDYEEYIFLFPIRDSKDVPIGPGSITVVLDASLPILTPEDLRVKYGNSWGVLSRMYGGEVYTYQKIDKSFIKEIRGV